MSHGIILTGGTGTRLRPHTNYFNKHMLYVNGKFIIDYPLQTLKSVGVTKLTVLLGGDHFDQIISYIKDGKDLGFESVNYVLQSKPSGIAEAINLCKHTVSGDFSVILGDNIFELNPKWSDEPGAQIMLADHPELNRFGVASVNNRYIVDIVEKPAFIEKYSGENNINYAISGLYKFTQEYFDYFKLIQPSKRDEFEITDIINLYNKDKKLSYSLIDGLWSDAGTHSSISYVNNYFYKKESCL